MLTNTILSSLSIAIESGRPLNAMLRAAEYLDGSEPIYKTLGRIAAQQLSAPHYAVCAELIAAVLKGKKLAQFNSKERARLLAIQEGSAQQSSRTREFAMTSISARLARREMSRQNNSSESFSSTANLQRKATARFANQFPRATLVDARNAGSIR